MGRLWRLWMPFCDQSILRPIPTRRQKMRAKEVFNFIIILSISIEPSHRILVILLLNAGGMPDRLNLLIWLPPEPAYHQEGTAMAVAPSHSTFTYKKSLHCSSKAFCHKGHFCARFVFPPRNLAQNLAQKSWPLDLWQNGSKTSSLFH
jgi:hypothetical protein